MTQQPVECELTNNEFTYFFTNKVNKILSDTSSTSPTSYSFTVS